ncbi:hypothetical protein ACFOGJ_16175 [Marinibaculum pumilum]|uniref:Uncharacterized protein n=1 Tax=Marinibaculum pumilum TaxID=1766165 RepID=A0ABV7L3C3_9PROT
MTTVEQVEDEIRRRMQASNDWAAEQGTQEANNQAVKEIADLGDLLRFINGQRPHGWPEDAP